MPARFHQSAVLAITIVAACACGQPGAWAAGPGAADADSIPADIQLRATFVVRILNFVQWSGPKADADTTMIGVVGDPDLAAALRRLEPGMHARPLKVLTTGSALELARNCEVVCVPAVVDGVPRAEHPQWGDTTWTADYQVLTIGDGEEFTASGGVIGFFTEKTRLQFAISEGAAERAGLTISSKLLRLAKTVP